MPGNEDGCAISHQKECRDTHTKDAGVPHVPNATLRFPHTTMDYVLVRPVLHSYPVHTYLVGVIQWGLLLRKNYYCINNVCRASPTCMVLYTGIKQDRVLFQGAYNLRVNKEQGKEGGVMSKGGRTCSLIVHCLDQANSRAPNAPQGEI